ncbi:MAG: GAF domain-containing sensor histidine kinase [Deltaproteobacteria bacterium]|nr:GAF domain-containing sensor histidine kinase [Deltaproteobacteria bacterium]MBW1993808.1 GAF domain-containing sensor histidine kinase [Deltaproteobacteria bacterium]
MNKKPTYAELEKSKEELVQALQDAEAKAQRFSLEIPALIHTLHAITKNQGLASTAQAVFDVCKKKVGATAGYVALLNADGVENEVLFLDSGGLPCTVDPNLPMPIRGLRSEAYLNATVVYENDFSSSKWMKYMPKGHVRLDNVMFAPLVLDGKAVGLLGMANKNGNFNDHDVWIATLFGEIASVALRNARSFDQHRRVEEEREFLIEELKEKNKELERFIYTISHDLKSPIITIKGFLGLLEQDVARGDIDRMRADIGRIRNAAEKMQHLLEDLLKLSKIGGSVDALDEVPFKDIVNEATNTVAGRLQERKPTIEITSDLPSVYGEVSRIRGAIENLIDNAAKFMGDQPNPIIEIGVQQNGDETIFYIRDNGIGIESEYHEKVFGLFDKLDQNIEGTGIGLTIVKKTIEKHGGRIWIESEGTGKGTTFCFTLPGRTEAMKRRVK